MSLSPTSVRTHVPTRGQDSALLQESDLHSGRGLSQMLAKEGGARLVSDFDLPVSMAAGGERLRRRSASLAQRSCSSRRPLTSLPLRVTLSKRIRCVPVKKSGSDSLPNSSFRSSSSALSFEEATCLSAMCSREPICSDLPKLRPLELMRALYELGNADSSESLSNTDDDLF